MNADSSYDVIRFALDPNRVRVMQKAYLAPAIVIVLFAAVVILGYDFAGAAASPPFVEAMFYGSIAGVFAVLGGLLALERRKAPQIPERGFLAVSRSGIDVDFGRGPQRIPFAGVTGISAVRPRADKKPVAIVFHRNATPPLEQGNQNRVMHKIGSRHARLHTFRGAAVMSLYLFGDQQADAIVSAIETHLQSSENREPVRL